MMSDLIVLSSIFLSDADWTEKWETGREKRNNATNA